MYTRRDALTHTLAAGVGLTLATQAQSASTSNAMGALIQRPIPSTGEMLPALGLGSGATFSSLAGSRDADALKQVLSVLVAERARVFDTAPSYGASEETAGRLAKELGLRDRIFWATKVNATHGRAQADPAAARAQINESFKRFGVETVDLIQVHDLSDVLTHLALLKNLKKQGRVRYVGVTTTDSTRYPELIEVMRSEPLDFIGVDYAVDNRHAENEVLPLARQRGIAVLGYVPFGRSSLFRRVERTPIPDWAREFDATTWAQFFIKYVLGHPTITCVTPATSSGEHLHDDLAGARGTLPSEATRRRMAAFIDTLPVSP